MRCVISDASVCSRCKAALLLVTDWSGFDQAVENRDGGGSNWGLLQMPFGDNSPQDVPWPNVPIRFSKQYYTMMQVQALLDCHKLSSGEALHIRMTY